MGGTTAYYLYYYSRSSVENEWLAYRSTIVVTFFAGKPMSTSTVVLRVEEEYFEKTWWPNFFARATSGTTYY